ncbi:hypothetical protein DVH24_025676 [Malus domestica]|uniref:Uncharacterized protein n=1 Tax=Malus domestica TaxID=3750 RepID=A0A498KDU8_MALDO|nr:hypothetical protein DVH24_025676 [Malus domestica]
MATVNISTHTFKAGAQELARFELHQAPQPRRQKPLLLFCASNQSFPLLIRLICFPIHCSCSSDTASPLSGWTNLLRYKNKIVWHLIDLLGVNLVKSLPMRIINPATEEIMVLFSP